MADAASTAPLPPVPQQASANIPSNANDGCVGPAAQEAGKAAACAGCPNRTACASGKGREVDPGEWRSECFVVNVPFEPCKSRHYARALRCDGGWSEVELGLLHPLSAYLSCEMI